MKDLNFFPLDVESNIYGMTTLEFEDRTTKVLVATLDCQIYCINYSKFKPQTKEVEFTYIPTGAKIISIGALKRGPNDFVIGITHSLAPSLPKNPTTSVGDYNKTTYYLNIYASGSATQTFDLDYVAQGCQTVRLRYVPYHLYSTYLPQIDGDNNEARPGTLKRRPVWLLTGGDKCIHAYAEDYPYQSFSEVPIEECFPELTDIQGLALWVDVLNIEANNERAIALGMEDGSVKFYHSRLNMTNGNHELIRSSSFDDYTTIIPCVRLFYVRSLASSELRNRLQSRKVLRTIDDGIRKELNLLVISSTDHSLVFKDVLNRGLDSRQELPDSKRLDCVTSATIGDTNVDGLNELLIGTHGRELLTYQYDLHSNSYRLDNISMLNYPIFALSTLDLTGDGLNDVIILLANGVLIMQALVGDALRILKNRVDSILALLTQT